MDGFPASEALPAGMDEAEKMLALKKVYADVILNTAKEAAARVLAAERKAKKYERELEFTKEEAIQMLVSMKQKMDAKNSESAVKSMNQQKKIKELELQLDEAEGLILDLRAKLNKFEEEHALNSSREKESAIQLCCQSSLSDLESNSAACKLQTPCLDDHSMVHQLPGPLLEHLTSNSDFDKCLVDNPVFDSIYFRKGGSELCNSECIQRIWAIEKDLIEGRMPLSDNLDECKSLVLKNEQSGVKFSIPSTTNKLNLIENVESGKPFLIDSATKGWSQKIQIFRKRRSRQGKSKSKVRGCRYLSSRYMKCQRTFSVISRCNTYQPSSTNVDRSGNLSKRNTRNEAEQVPEVKRMDVFTSHGKEDLSHGKHEHVSVCRRSARKRKVKQWDGFSTLCQPNGANPHQNEGSYKKSKESHCTTESNELPLDEKYEVKVEDHKCAAPLAIIRKRIEASVDSCVATVSQNDSSLIDVPMLVTSATMELEDMSSVPSDKKGNRMSRLTNTADSKHQSSKSTANTFRRKRKNMLWMNLSSDEQSKTDLAPLASPVKESLDDSRGLVQIAHQLISLSAKGWP